MSEGDIIFDKDNFKVTVSEESDLGACLVFAGDPFSPDFMNNLKPIEDAVEALPQPHMLIDAQHVINPNSRFIILLLALFNSGKTVGLKMPPKFLYDLLEVMGILGCFAIYDSLDAFLEKADQ